MIDLSPAAETQRILDQVRNAPQTRETRIEARAIDADARTADLAFSSEAPVDRWYGREILDHSPGAMRLGRLRDGAPLLLQHDPDRQIGVIEAVRVDADAVGRSKVRFSRGALGEEVLRDVQDGIRSKVSVGYMIHSMRLDSTQDGIDTYRVDDWEPIEVSIVSIPADTSVGIGRSLPPATSQHQESPMTPELETPVGGDEIRSPDPVAVLSATTPESPDATEMRRIGVHFGLRDLAEDHAILGTDLGTFRTLVRKVLADRIQPVPVVARVEARIPQHAGSLRAFTTALYGTRQAAEEAAYRAGQFCRATIFGDTESARWCRDFGVQLALAGHDMRQVRVLTGSGAGQSVLIPDELALPIISLREAYGLARRLCYIHPMASDTASIPRDTGDVTAYFVGRESVPTANDPTFDNINLVARNVAAETRISNDYAEDSVINLADYVAQKHARSFASKEDECLINGDGTSTYGGIVGLRALLTEAGGRVGAVLVSTVTHNLYSEIDAGDLRAVIGTLPDFPGINPSWVVSKPASNAVFGRLTDAAGGNSKSDLGAGMPDQWGGYPIVTTQSMPKTLGSTDYNAVAMILFGDFRMGVVLGDRRGMTMIVDPYSLSSYQQTKIIHSERFDLNCHGVGDSTSAGPICALVGSSS
jgi:HK97 family phage major capsid protein/HK97 family phage prohead protease